MNWIYKQTIIKKEYFHILAGIFIAVFFCLLGLFNIKDVSAATVECIDCADCSSKIQSAVSGDIVILTADITNQDGNCIDFGGSANGITFDGDNHSISGDYDYSGYGVWLNRISNNTVKNCDISGFYKGAYAYSGSNNTFQNIDSHSNRSSGIEILYSYLNTVSDSFLHENRSYDFYFYSDSETNCNNTLTNVIGSDNRPIGFYNSSVNLADQEFSALYLCNADNSTLDNITINGSSSLSNNGLRVFYTDNTSFNNVTSSNNNRGILLSDSNSNNLQNIQCNSNYNGGIFVDESQNNIINSAQTNSNSQCGIYIMESPSNSLNDITSSNNSSVGIYFDRSSLNTLENATIDSNNYGISTGGSLSITVKDSHITNNRSYGIGLNPPNNSGAYLIHNNYFSNLVNASLSKTYANTWNTALTAGTNIVNGPSLGGNYWAKPNGSGYSQNCVDGDRDGICDISYTIGTNNIDNFPLADYSPTHTISGTVNYYNGEKVVPDATVILSAFSGTHFIFISTTTDTNGYYEFTDLEEGWNYHISVSKEDDSNEITGSDITMIAQHIVGINPFGSIFQMIASDVNESKSVTGADITMIAQYVVGLITELDSGDWKFYSTENTPTEANYLTNGMERVINPTSDMTDQNFTGVKMGDANGSWGIE